jgi:cytochrome c-type biogenesis protein CcmE
VSEVTEQQSTLNGKNLRVNGTVAAGSDVYDIKTLTLTFDVIEGGKSLPVKYTGALPDNFRGDTDVVIEGQLDSSGVILADNILTKCPSKYVPQ